MATTRPQLETKTTRTGGGGGGGARPRNSYSDPLIPEHNAYSYKPTVAADALRELLAKVYPVEERNKIKASLPDTTQGTCKLTHVLCASGELLEKQGSKDSVRSKALREEFENALAKGLALREHLRAFLTHNVIVTMVGAVVARALERATCENAMNKVSASGCSAKPSDDEVRELTLDLLADRYFVRNIVCHDSSKTSAVEAAAYSGIMALHIAKARVDILQDKEKRRRKPGDPNPARDKQWDEYANLEQLTGPMADFGFTHHYRNNPHHPEYYGKGRMADMHVVEAVVDGLACVFERVKPTSMEAWLKMFFVGRFPHDENKALAEKVILALKTHVSADDYRALEALRTAVHTIAGESVPWSKVTMTDCCNFKHRAGPERYETADLSTYFE